MTELHHVAHPARLKVAVVGPCASGKTTLVRNLRNQGYDAYAVAQEHSAVPALWNHLQPDVLIALRADLSTILRRRGPSWSQDIYEAQLRRLQEAYASADLLIDTGKDSEAKALAQSLALLEQRA